jgi:hypothetical protein
VLETIGVADGCAAAAGGRGRDIGSLGDAWLGGKIIKHKGINKGLTKGHKKILKLINQKT